MSNCRKKENQKRHQEYRQALHQRYLENNSPCIEFLMQNLNPAIDGFVDVLVKSPYNQPSYRVEHGFPLEAKTKCPTLFGKYTAENDFMITYIKRKAQQMCKSKGITCQANYPKNSGGDRLSIGMRVKLYD